MQFIASQLIIDIISNPLIYIATNSNLKTQNSEKSSIFALVTMQSVSSILRLDTSAGASLQLVSTIIRTYSSFLKG